MLDYQIVGFQEPTENVKIVVWYEGCGKMMPQVSSSQFLYIWCKISTSFVGQQCLMCLIVLRIPLPSGLSCCDSLNILVLAMVFSCISICFVAPEL